MTTFIVRKYYWNDSGDYNAYWNESNTDPEYIVVNNEQFAEDIIKEYVHQLNKQYVDIAIDNKNKEIERAKIAFVRTFEQHETAQSLSEEQAKRLDIDKEKIQYRMSSNQRDVERLEGELERLINDPFDNSHNLWDAPVRDKFEYECFNSKVLDRDPVTGHLEATEAENAVNPC